MLFKEKAMLNPVVPDPYFELEDTGKTAAPAAEGRAPTPPPDEIPLARQAETKPRAPAMKKKKISAAAEAEINRFLDHLQGIHGGAKVGGAITTAKSNMRVLIRALENAGYSYTNITNKTIIYNHYFKGVNT